MPPVADCARPLDPLGDAIVTTAIKRQLEPPRVVGDLLNAELNEKQARSMKYQLTVAKLPFAKELDEFVFADTPINEPLVRHLAAGGFLAQQRNLVLVGGTGSGKTHLAVGIARACIRSPTPRRQRLGEPGRCAWPLLQCCRSGQQARRRGTSQPPHADSGAALPITSAASTSSSSTSSAICPSPRLVVSCSST
jgi:hypothetical protein